MINEYSPPPPQSQDETANRMAQRIELAHTAIETSLAALRGHIAGHYAWRDRLDAERPQLSCPADKETQTQLIAVIESRIQRFEHQIATCRHDMALLRHHAPRALENIGANTGDLARLIDKYEAGTEYDPSLKPRLQGLDALPGSPGPAQPPASRDRPA